MSERKEIPSSLTIEWDEEGQRKQYLVELGISLNKTPIEQFRTDFSLYGQYASVYQINDNTYEAFRDPLGIGKLFYTETSDGKLHFSNTFVNLFQFKSKIFSIPPGKHVRLGSHGLREQIRQLVPENTINHNFTVESFKEANADNELNIFRGKFELRLQQAFFAIRKLEDEGWNIIVALSGGLDSSIIASKASEYLQHPIACTLDLGKSEDSEKSIKTAKHLGIEHYTFPTSEAEILEVLEEAPSLSQDYRDFNVHCAALNILLAKNIRKYVDSKPDMDKEKIIVLTGDLMNEFTCDYAGEFIDGVEYYKLPKLEPKDLQTYLIRGLDTSDRELSPFDAYGIKCIQPYAIVYDLFTSLDESILLSDDPKKLLNTFLVDPTIEGFIPKVKLRAQVGSRENMGILGLCHKFKLNNKHFMDKLLMNSEADKGAVPIFVGKYDVEKFS